MPLSLLPLNRLNCYVGETVKMVVLVTWREEEEGCRKDDESQHNEG